MKKTQLQMIKNQLLTYGEVSRNWCLSKFISRLSARIDDLEKEGWTFETEKRGGDFVYIAIQIPAGEKTSEEKIWDAQKEINDMTKKFNQLTLSI